jgi:hypothetical protein
VKRSCRKEATLTDKEFAMRRRGGYSGNRVHVVKCRISPDLYETLMLMATEKQIAMALLLRELVHIGLKNV